MSSLLEPGNLHPLRLGRWVWLLAAGACSADVSPAGRGDPAQSEPAPIGSTEAPSSCAVGEPGVFVDGTWYSPSLQAALDSAPAGAVIELCPWTYLGPFVANRAVTLTRASDLGRVSETILEGYTAGTVLTLAADSTVRGITIRGGRDTPFGGGLRLDGVGAYTVEDCVVEGNVAALGGGIAVGAGATVSIVGSTIRGNEADTGGGLSVGPGSAVALVDTEITLNAAELGGGVSLDNGSLVGGAVVDNTVTDATLAPYPATVGGAGIHTTGDCTVEGTTVSANRGANAPGIYVQGGAVTLSGLSVTDNVGEEAAGGGLTCVDATVAMPDTEIHANLAGDGGGVWARGCTLTGGVISRNVSVDDGGGVVLAFSTLTEATVSGNVAGGYPSGVWLADSADLVDSVVTNHGGEWGAVEAGPNSRILRSSVVDNKTCAVLVSGQVTLEDGTLLRNAAGACLVGGSNPTAMLVSIASDWGVDADDNTIDLTWSGSTYRGYGANATFTCADGCQPPE